MAELWLIEPRDPLVLGDGRGIGPQAPGAFRGLPLPGTVAGMVRTWFVRGESQVSPDQALELLHVKIRGPWLVQRGEDGEALHLFPVGSDVRCDQEGALRVGQVHQPAAGQGVLWQKGAPEELWPVTLPERDAKGEKLRSPDPAQWPLDTLVALALDQPVQHPYAVAASADGPKPPEVHLTHKETRTHVAILPESGTASPGQLFTSGGIRFREGLALAVEVSIPPALSARAPAPGAGLVVLGGESRLSFRHLSGAAFPDFKPFEQRYAAAAQAAGASTDSIADATESQRTGPFLRLQLLTPAYLPDGVPGIGADAGWLPRWLRQEGQELQGEHPDLPGVTLTLRAVCLGRATAVSGWDLQAAKGRGAPRQVRRLVPAGSIYYFALPKDADLLAACAALWGQPLDPARPTEGPDPTEHRAPPAWDGYGLVLPGLWRPNDEDENRAAAAARASGEVQR